MPKTKFLKSDYMIIFNLHADGYRNKEIAQKYGVTPSVISKVLHRKFEIKTDRGGERNSNSKLKKEDVEKICLYRERGYTYATIAVLFNVTRTHCSRVVNGIKWPETHRKAS